MTGKDGRMARIRRRHVLDDPSVPVGACDTCYLLDIIDNLEIAMAKAGLAL